MGIPDDEGPSRALNGLSRGRWRWDTLAGKLGTSVSVGLPLMLASLIRLTVPLDQWYSAAFHLSRVAAPLLCALRRGAWNGPLSQAVFINRLLALLTRTHRPFPVPWQAEGLDELRENLGRPGGVVLCSAHLPLVKVACRALMDAGIPVSGVIASNPSVTDSLAVWGRTERMTALQTGANVLVRARSLLRAGNAVMSLADGLPGAAFSPAIFHLAERLHSHVFLFSVDLRRDGVVLVRFFAPDHPGVDAHLSELRREVDRIRLRQPIPVRPQEKFWLA